MCKRPLLVMAILCLFQTVFCQALQPGDPIPEGLTITGVQNSPVSEIQLRDLKGKLVILDFWSTWCTACIAAFPKLHQLQKEFKDEVKIILVNTYESDSLTYVTELFKKREARTGLTVDLPYSLRQKALLEFFPHQFLPHCVWISKEGEYLGASAGNQLTAENIRLAINNKETKTFLYKADRSGFNPYQPLFAQEEKIPEQNLVFQSTITPYIEGLGFRHLSNTLENGSFHFSMINYPLLDIYKKAFELGGVPRHRMVFESGHFNHLLKETEAEDPQNRNFCYEIILPRESRKILNLKMRSDLEYFFGMTVKKEARSTEVVELFPPEKLPQTKQQSGKHYRIVSLKNLVRHLNMLHSLPIICETPKSELTIELPLTFFKKSVPEQLSDLKKNGFEFRTYIRLMDCYVFTDWYPTY